MALIDRIKYDGELSPWLIYKYPGEEFVLGSQLIVAQGQEALFCKGGRALDVFCPGTHTLNTGNIPLLKKYVNMPFGKQSPFTAEIYYVNRTSKMDMNWGTANPILLEDPKYGIIISVRSHGKYGIKILDTRVFVSELIGAIPQNSMITHQAVASHFSGLLTSSIKQVIASFMIREKISFLEVTAYLNELSEKCYEKVKHEFGKYGVEITNFYIETISPPKNDIEKLKGYKEEVALGRDFYTQRRSLDIMEKMAGNEGAGGSVNAGIGLVMGVSAATNAANQFDNIASNAYNSNAESNKNQNSDVTCPKCGERSSADQKFCGKCGYNLKGKIKKCKRCGQENPADQKFCGKCGVRLSNKCSVCGFENLEGIKCCVECGTEL